MYAGCAVHGNLAAHLHRQVADIDVGVARRGHVHLGRIDVPQRRLLDHTTRWASMFYLDVMAGVAMAYTLSSRATLIPQKLLLQHIPYIHRCMARCANCSESLLMTAQHPFTWPCWAAGAACYGWLVNM